MPSAGVVRPARLFLLAAAVEIAILSWICATSDPRRTAIIGSNDTRTYLSIAQHLAALEPPGPSHRTLGYPIFLGLCHLLSAGRAPLPVAIALQLALNLMLVSSVWRLLEALAGGVRPGLRLAAAGVVFVAGLDLALVVLTDFLASAAFFGFAVALLLRRDARGLTVGAALLVVATLTRPSFTLLPILLLASIPLVRRATRPIPIAHIAAYLIVSFASTGASIAYQYAYLGYLGPSNVVSSNLKLTIRNVQATANLPVEDFDARFREALEAEAGKPESAIGPNERDALSARLLRREIATHPVAFVRFISTAAAKYAFAPFEGTVARLLALSGSPGDLDPRLRGSLAIAGLPFFLIALARPPRGRHSERAYHAFAVLWFGYFVCIAALAPTQGERMRLPAVPLLAPLFAWNGERLLAWLTRLRTRATSILAR